MNTFFFLGKLNPLPFIREWLATIEIHDLQAAQFLCRIIPASCPFERDLKFFNHTFAHIPSLCNLNPFYDQIMGLRFKSLAYLANELNVIE